MQTTKIKILILLSCLLISVYLLVSFLGNGVKMKKIEEDSDILKVGFPSRNRVSDYEPTRIYLADSYIFLESIYSTLINLSDDKGDPVSSIAKEHYWKGNELHLIIRDDLLTVDGYQIDIDDVIFSLKRVLVLSENTHGDLKNLICLEADLKSVELPCPGIMKDGNTLILKLQSKRNFLVSMLAAIDFAIIPKTSVDPQTLKIIDYRNTTGPYYVEEDQGDGNIILKANPRHFEFSKNMASEIRLIPTKGLSNSQVVEWFNQGKIDHITTIDGLQVEDTKEIDSAQVNIHETIHIYCVLASITSRGRKRLSINRRLAFAKSLQKSFHEFYAEKEGYRLSRQFLLPIGEGHFSKDESLLLEKVMGDVEMDRSGSGIHLSVFPNLDKKNGDVAKYYMPDLKVERSDSYQNFVPMSEEDIPDYVIFATDSGFLDDISLLSYSISSETFGLSKKEGKDWLKDYMDTENKREQVDKIKKMQLKVLMEGRMIPLVTYPAIAVARKPWTLQLSELFANNALWKIRKN